MPPNFYVEINALLHSASVLDDLAEASGKTFTRTDEQIQTATSRGWVGTSQRAMTMAIDEISSQNSQICSRVENHHSDFLSAAQQFAQQEAVNADRLLATQHGQTSETPKLNL